MEKHYCPYCMAPVPEGETCRVCGLTAGNYVPSPHHLPPGTVLLDRYLVGRALGEGGFGITYIGCDLRLEMKVAIKEYYPLDRATRNASASLEVTSFIGPSEKSYERGKQKFLNEAQIMAKMVKQQVIVSVRDYFEANNTAYIVMEYVEGITFRELVDQRGGKIAPEELFPMIEPLFHALTMMHENGLIHRDISPDNLMLENGKIRLLDFGCAREASRGTETMTIALKHGYAPIEQYQQKGQGPWTDIYALSATIYYCLTGKTPPQALDRITEDTLLLPRKLGIDITTAQERALVKGMRLQPNRRYQTAEEFRAALYDKAAEETDEEAQEAAGKSAVAPVMTADLSGEPEAESSEEPAGEEVKALEEPAEEEEDETPASDSGKKQEEPVSGKHSIFHNIPRKTLYLAGAVAACLVVVIVVAVALNSGTEDAVVKHTGTEAGTEVMSAEENEEPPAEPDQFEHAYRFSSGESEEFANLMENDSVLSVIVDCGSFSASGISIAKPVLVKPDTVWRTDDLTVTEDGYLHVQGTLDLAGNLRLFGNGDTRLYLDRGSKLAAGDASLIWQDDENCLVNAGGEMEDVHTLVFSEDVFEQDDTISVTSWDELVDALDKEYPISIDGDLVLEEGLDIDVPIRVSEGVTVDSQNDPEHEERSFNKFWLCAVDGSVLVNNGTINTRLWAGNGSAVINYGEVETSYWFEDQCVLVNLGTIRAYNTSRTWNDSLFVNMGDLVAYSVYLTSGDISNFGNITVVAEGNIGDGEDGYLEVLNGSILWNRCGGTVSVASTGRVVNNGRIVNEGEFVVEKSGRFYNTVFENDGLFQAKKGAEVDAGRYAYYGNSELVDKGRTGIYYGTGEFDLGTADVEVYRTAVKPCQQDGWEDLFLDGSLGEVSRVTGEPELSEALAASDVGAVRVTGDITVSHDLTVRKPMLIEDGASLTFEDGAALTVYESTIILLDSASLRGSSILLYEKAQLCLQEYAVFIVDEGGTLAFDNSLLWGDKAAIRMDGANFTLKNRSSFAFPSVASFTVDGCEIRIQDDAVFIPSCREDITLSGASVSLENAVFQCASDTVMENCTLEIGESALFRNAAETLSLRGCAVKVSKNGEFYSDCANFSLLNGSPMENRGSVFVGGWGEDYTFTVHGNVTNYCEMELLISFDFSEPIHNEGNLYCDDRLDDSNVTGNAPIIED